MSLVLGHSHTGGNFPGLSPYQVPVRSPLVTKFSGRGKTSMGAKEPIQEIYLEG